MNILMLSWRDPKHPMAGGAEQVMHEHAKGWIAEGHNVTLFSSRFQGSLEREEIDGVCVVRRGNQYHLGVQIAGYFFYQKNKENFDIVIDQFHGFPFFTPLYVGRPKLAVVQETAREVWFLNPLPKPFNWVYATVGYFAEPVVYQLYKNVQFMTGSESAKNSIAELGIPLKNITIVPHGVIIKKPKKMPPREKIFTLTYLGVLSKDKGIEDALRCFSTLSKQGKFQFWVIGKPETKSYEYRLLQEVNRLGLAESLKFWGFVSQAKKFELLARSHILINPSVREGWGLVNIEANSMGTPVVAYNVAGSMDSVRDGISGVLCKSNTPEDIASNALEIRGSKKKFIRLQKGALAWGNKFSWKKSRGLSLSLLNETVNEI